jgi:hypothetical protein
MTARGCQALVVDMVVESRRPRRGHHVEIDGNQRPEWANCASVTATLTPSRHRALAEALLVAADEYGQMAGYGLITVLNQLVFPL